jgi:phosphoglycolate phosphatase
LNRLVLFDVDGTVLSGGPARASFQIALQDVFGTAGPIDEWEFSGKTDPQIAQELLHEAGVERPRIDAGLPGVWERYLAEMEARLPKCPTQALPGAKGLLALLDHCETVAVGLLTGNVVGGARLKIRSAGLEGWLSGVGAFGSDHEARNELPAIAIHRAEKHWGVRFSADEVVVVGDTPRDVGCGRAYGTRTVAVATGRFGAYSLAQTGADVVLESLRDTDRALRAILN